MTSLEEIKMGKYKHFKGKMYELIDIALHSETNEYYAVYRALMDMDNYTHKTFRYVFSKVDKEKYPNIEQKYKFKYVGDFNCECKDKFCLILI